MKNPIMTIKMANGKCIIIELYPKYALNTVASVISIATKGYYDGKEFYRIVKDFVIQTGCDGKNPVPEADYVLPLETVNSGFDTKPPSFLKGIVGMAGMRECTSGSSFFIMTGDSPGLDGDFPVIGNVIEGMEEVERINNVECDETYYKHIPFFAPKTPEIMEKVTVETFGETYPEPKTIPKPQSYLDQEKEIDNVKGK